MNPDWRSPLRSGRRRRPTQAGPLRAAATSTRGVAVEWKQDQRPVTVADREAEELLRTHACWASFPAMAFSARSPATRRARPGYRWIIDPIDGTRSFVRGIPLWATLVGLEYQGELIAGVADVPALGQTYRALRGDGAYRDDRPHSRFRRRRPRRGARLLFELSLVRQGRARGTFLELVERTQRQRGFGDFYGFVLVAQGSGELMVEHGVHAWDVAALKPIVEEAGGRFTDWDGKLDIDRPDVLASNGMLHDEALRDSAT